jgi:ATP-binding cassette subfamily F protein 3
MLAGLGFSAFDQHRPVRQLSGGQRTRALLAQLLLTDPDLLILDEPTNHLDIAAVEWLERFLRESKGAVVIVSHDRYFLDRVVDTIWEIGRMGFETYRGTYSAYLTQRGERWKLRERLFTAEIGRMENELDYIRKNIAGQNTHQAKGRLRRLSRQIEAIEQSGLLGVQGRKWGEISGEVQISGRSMGVEEAGSRIRGLQSPLQTMPDLSLSLRTKSRSGDLVLRTRSLAVGYADEPDALFRVPDLVLLRGECAAVIGPNGAGKTTFLKTILGQIEPLEGEVELGASLDVGYFAQGHEGLNPDRTLVEEIWAEAPLLTEGEVRNLLARFLFRGDEVYKTVRLLSGGERGRLALARLSLASSNLLLLDEPTNHLDIPSQETLEAVLAGFPGTILLVSHDRYLIDALGTQIWEIGGRGEALTVFKGTYSEYRASREVEKSAATPAMGRSGHQPGDSRRVSRPQSKQAIQRRQARLAGVEAEIRALEGRLLEIGGKLERPPSNLEQVEQLGEEYVELQGAIEALIQEWESLVEQPGS